MFDMQFIQLKWYFVLGNLLEESLLSSLVYCRALSSCNVLQMNRYFVLGDFVVNEFVNRCDDYTI